MFALTMFHYIISPRGSSRLSGSIVLMTFLTVTAVQGLFQTVSFSKLNNVLVDLVPNSELSANLEKANEMLPEEEAKKSSLVEPLKLFLLLNEVTTGNEKCSLESFKVLKDADKATGGGARAENAKLRRLDKFVRDISLKRAKKCIESDYSNQVETIMKTMDPNHLAATERYATRLQDAYDSLIMGHPRDISSAWKRAFGSDYWKLVDPSYPMVALQIIKDLSKKDPDSRADKIFDGKTGNLYKDKLRSLYDKYLIEPCKVFISELGPTLEMIADDCRLYEQVDPATLHRFPPEKSNLDQLEKCDLLVNRDDKRIFKEIVSLVDQKSW